MGIPKFAYFISNRYPLIIKKIKEQTDIPEIDNLYLDINGIIHNVSHKYFCDASQINETTKQIYKDVCDVIKKIVHLIKPKELLMISADGVAPRAKMNQQRIRRFRKEMNIILEEEEKREKEKIEINQESKNQNENENEKKIFDSNAISAGTKFMFNLTIYMKEYIINEKKNNNEWNNMEILLTGSDVPGEGEHKILEYIRNFKNSEKYNPYIRHCIYGLDADLIMLSLITHENNIVILREDTFLMRKKEKLEKKGIEIINKNKNNNNSNDNPYEFLLISVLREYLELEFSYLKNKISFKYNFERIIDDFIFLCFFVGNDFLPNLFSFNIENGALTHLFQFYKACLPELDGYLTDKGKINISRIKKLFSFLSKQELHSIDMLIRNNKTENKKNRIKTTNDSKEQIKLLIKQKKEEKKKKLFEEIKSRTKNEQMLFKRNKINKKIIRIKKQFEEISNEINKKYNFEDEYKKYKDEGKTYKEDKEIPQKIKDLLSESIKYENYIINETYCSDFREEDINNSDISDIDVKNIMNEILEAKKESEKQINKNEKEDNEDINQIFIQNLNGLKNAKEVKEFYYKEKLKIDINTDNGKKERDTMFHLYLEGLQWILYYYYLGIKSWKWYYPYYYSPMISDFPEITIDDSIYNIFDKFDNGISEPFNPYQSLLFILPKQSFNLIPNCYKNIPKEIPEYYPDKVEIDYNGKTASYESLLLLPFIDDKKLLELEKKNRQLNIEEEKENKWGNSYLFYKNELNNNDINYINYEIYQNKSNTLINKDIKKCDFSFPTLKTIDYDYLLINVKQYYGKTSSITKQINILPKMKQKINEKKIGKYLYEKTIFVDYPNKSLAKIRGLVYGKLYYYLYNDILYIDNRFKLTKEFIESIRYAYAKKGIILEHPEILCDVVKFKGFGLVKGKMKRTFDENNSSYVPFEITSLNATSNDFDKFISHLNHENSDNIKKKNNNFKKY